MLNREKFSPSSSLVILIAGMSVAKYLSAIGSDYSLILYETRLEWIYLSDE